MRVGQLASNERSELRVWLGIQYFSVDWGRRIFRRGGRDGGKRSRSVEGRTSGNTDRIRLDYRGLMCSGSRSRSYQSAVLPSLLSTLVSIFTIFIFIFIAVVIFI